MQIKDVSISKGMTVNLGNYNSHRVEVGVTASFDEEDDVQKGIEQITTMVNQKLAKEISQVTAENQKKQVLMETERG